MPDFINVKIRNEFDEKDIKEIAGLHKIVYDEELGYDNHFQLYVEEGLEEFTVEYNPEEDRIWVCEINSKIIGSLFLKGRGKSAQLRYFLILPDYRGKGIGNKLMELFCKFLYEKGFQSAYLWTTSELDTAAALYKKFGFVLVEERENKVWKAGIKEQKYEKICTGRGT